MALSLDESTNVALVSVPASGGTDAGTFLAEFKPDADAEVEVKWPWPETWPVTSE